MGNSSSKSADGWRHVEHEERIPVLDGVRGIAVLAVLCVHFLPDIAMPSRTLEWTKKAMQTGWIGVELFFVLSGFLITGILLRTKRRPSYFKNFYLRRILRIFPLYYGALVFVFVVMPAIGAAGGENFGPIQSTQAWHWFYGSNLNWWAHGDAAMASSQVELRHFWSLAVEEHFYLVWPVLVFITPRLALRRVCIILVLVSLAVRAGGLWAYGPHSPFFYVTPCRFDGLAAGAFVASLARDKDLASFRGAAWAIVFGCAGFLAWRFLGTKGLWASDPWIRSGGLSAIVIGFAAGFVILLSAAQQSWTVRLLSSRILRFFGKYSYGLYVIHGLMLPWLSRWLPTDTWLADFRSPFVGCLALAATKILIVIPFALVSWHCWENLFLRLKPRFSSPSQVPRAVPEAT